MHCCCKNSLVSKGSDASSRRLLSTNGHAVYVTPPSQGSRSAAIVIHKDVTHCIVPDSYRVQNRCASVLVQWEGHNINLVTAHLPPRPHTLAQYSQKLDDVDTIIHKHTVGKIFRDKGQRAAELNKKKHYTIRAHSMQYWTYLSSSCRIRCRSQSFMSVQWKRLHSYPQ